MTPFRSLQVILLLLLLGIDADCAYPPKIPLRVEYAGCQKVLLPGPVCVLEAERGLSLWVGAPPEAQIEIQAGGEWSKAAGEMVQDGRRFSLSLPPAAEEVNVVVEAANGRATWSLALAEPARDLLSEAEETMNKVYDDIQGRRLAAARKKMNAFQLPPEAPAEVRCQLSYYGGLLAEKEGDYRTALAEVQNTVEIAEGVQLDRFKWLAEEKLALLLCGVGRFRESAQLFDRLARTPQFADSCDEAQFLSNQAWSALLAGEAGESLGDPAPLLEKALKTYETCEKVTPEKRVNILINLALAHLQGGRLAEAKNRLGQAHELEPHPSIPLMLWRLDLEARIILSERRPAEALRLFADLQELALATSSPDGRLRAAFGQARSYEALGDRPAALETLLKAEALLDEQSLQIPLHEGREKFMATRQAVVSLHVELLLKQDLRAEALAVARHGWSRMLRQLERSDRLANLNPRQRASWERLLTAYQEKRAALEERAKNDLNLPGDERRHEQAVGKAEAEAAKKFLDQAFLILGDLEGLNGEALPPPRPGELILTYHPLPHGWVGFAADGKTVRAHRFELPPDALLRPEELAQRLLIPFRNSIKVARRVRILPSGPLQGIDFHALPFDGDILLASAPVTYGLDLPVPSVPAQAPGRHALLVANPRDDLPGSLAEAQTIRKILESWDQPWITEELKTSEASLKNVQAHLGTADLLHYAGHGTFSGSGGWESSLLLADETQLTLGDLLTLERVPTWVVLSGCDTGRSSTETSVESLGLAHAFLLAGSRAVVASIRRVDDRTARSFFAEFYRQWDRDPDLAVALQRAQLSWRQQNPKADWQSFRLFEP